MNLLLFRLRLFIHGLFSVRSHEALDNTTPRRVYYYRLFLVILRSKKCQKSKLVAQAKTSMTVQVNDLASSDLVAKKFLPAKFSFVRQVQQK